MNKVNDNKLASKQASKQASKPSVLNSPQKSSKSPNEALLGDLNLPEKLIKSKKRVKQFGEVFTPEEIVKQMCDLCEPEISRIDGKIFEPTCGNGNFLVEILRRKLAKIKFKNQKQFEFDILTAISNIYAVDIQHDNVLEARSRLRSEVFAFIGKRKNSFSFIDNLDLILHHTILLGDTLKQKAKLTFYDLQPDKKTFTFEISQHTLHEIEQTYAKTKRSTPDNLAQTFKEFESPPEKPKPKRHVRQKSPPEMTATAQKNLKQASLF